MTLKELSQLYYLRKEIALDQKRLDNLVSLASCPPGPDMSGMPHGGSPGSRTEQLAVEIAYLRGLIDGKRLRCVQEQVRLEQYIQSIPDSLTRMIFRLRFSEGLSWQQVAFEIGGNNTADSVKKVCYRYLKAAKKADEHEKTFTVET